MFDWNILKYVDVQKSRYPWELNVCIKETLKFHNIYILKLFFNIIHYKPMTSIGSIKLNRISSKFLEFSVVAEKLERNFLRKKNGNSSLSHRLLITNDLHRLKCPSRAWIDPFEISIRNFYMRTINTRWIKYKDFNALYLLKITSAM